MNQANVDRAEMSKAATQIDTKHTEIQGIQNNLSSQVNALRAGWIGQASDSFYKAYTQFDGEFEKVKQGLEQIHGKLVQSQMSYVQTEEEQQAASNPILGML